MSKNLKTKESQIKIREHFKFHKKHSIWNSAAFPTNKALLFKYSKLSNFIFGLAWFSLFQTKNLGTLVAVAALLTNRLMYFFWTVIGFWLHGSAPLHGFLTDTPCALTLTIIEFIQLISLWIHCALMYTLEMKICTVPSLLLCNFVSRRFFSSLK